jgi:hypothetical protein
MNIPVMAVKITEETYPIAVACLAAGFATIPKKKVMGNYLVINKMEARTFKSQGERPWLVMSNSHMSEKLFRANYRFVIVGEPHKGFTEVEPID